MRWGEAICNAPDLPSFLAALSVPTEELMSEVIELNEWVRAVNVLDSALEEVLRSHSELILLWDCGGPPKQRPVPADSKVIMEAIVKVNTTTC